MITRITGWVAVATTLLAGLPSDAQIRLVSEHLRNEDADAFGNTFFGEIDVMDRDAPAPEFVAASMAQGSRETVAIEDGKLSPLVSL